MRIVIIALIEKWLLLVFLPTRCPAYNPTGDRLPPIACRPYYVHLLAVRTKISSQCKLCKRCSPKCTTVFMSSSWRSILDHTTTFYVTQAVNQTAPYFTWAIFHLQPDVNLLARAASGLEVCIVDEKQISGWRKHIYMFMYICIYRVSQNKRTFRMLEPHCTGSNTICRHPLCLEIDFLVVSY